MSPAGQPKSDPQVAYAHKTVTHTGGMFTTYISSDSDSDSLHSQLATPPASLEGMASTIKDKHIAQSHHSGGGSSTAQDERYVRLDPDYTLYHTWSNEPQDLDLYGVFSEEGPNLASDFNVKGLKPIMKDGDGDMFLLTDSYGKFYLWDPWDGHLLRASEKWTTKDGMAEIEEKVDNILRNLHWVLKQATVVFKH